MSDPTKIIVPAHPVDKDKLTEEEKTAVLSDAFRMEDRHAEIPKAKEGLEPGYFAGDEHMLQPEGGVEIASAPLVRGQMLGEAQGMKPRRPLSAHAATVSADASLDNVPPMLRAKVLAEREKGKGDE